MTLILKLTVITIFLVATIILLFTHRAAPSLPSLNSDAAIGAETIPSIDCLLIATRITDADGKKQTSFTWSFTKDTSAWVPEIGFLYSSSSGTLILDSEIIEPKTFTLIVVSDRATTTCDVIVNP